MKSKESYIYIMTNCKNTTLYIGVTSNFERRVYEHKNKVLKGFTEKYNLTKLVYYEVFENIEEAITREKQLKKFLRQGKNRLINKYNKEWIDLCSKNGQILTLPLVAENDKQGKVSSSVSKSSLLSSSVSESSLLSSSVSESSLLSSSVSKANVRIYKTKQGFTLSEILITMAVLAIFAAVVIPLFTIQKNFTGRDKDAADCVIKEGAASLTSTACAAALSKCERNKGNTCNTLLNLVGSYSDPALTVLGQACDNGGKQACGILINRCIDDSDNCDIASETYDIHEYLARQADNTALTEAQINSKDLMYNLLKAKMDLGVSNLYNRAMADCQADSASMACTLVGHKLYHFNQEDEADFAEMDSEYGTIFKNSNARLTNDYWIKRYGGAGDDQGQSIVVSGNYIYVAGYEASDTAGNYDVFVMKLNKSDGTSVWKKHYGGVSSDKGTLLAVSGDYIYATGYEQSDTAGLDDVFVMKLNESDGSSVWKKHYGGASFDQAYSLAVSGGYIYVTGREISDTAGSFDVFVMKLNESDGSSVWKKHYGGTNSDNGALLTVSGGYVYVVGYEASDTAGDGDVFVMKLNESDGTTVWKKHYGGVGFDYSKSFVVSGSYIYVIGSENSDTTGSYDAFVMKLNESDGSSVWKKHYGGSNSDEAYFLALDGNYIYITAYEQSDTSGNYEILIMKLNESDGSSVWKKHCGAAGSDTGYSLAVSGDYIYITGYENSDTAGGYDVFVMRINKHQTSSKMNSFWTADGVAMGALWTADGLAIKNTVAAPTLWATAGTVTTGATGIAMGAGWTADGTAMGAGWTDATMGAGWTADGVPITGFIADYYYIMTSATNNISNIKSKIISATITQDTTASGTAIKYLVSFDGGSGWKKWDGDSWEVFDTSTGLTGYTVASGGNTAAEVQTGLTNYTVPAGSSLDILIYLSTTDYRNTPTLDSIDIWYY